MFQPNAQQQALFDWVQHGSGNLFLRARAGTGKSTTLVRAMAHMHGSVAAAAFNRKAGDELNTKIAEFGIPTTDKRAGTFHSFGFAAVRRALPKAKLDARQKSDRILAELQVPRDLEAFTLKLVSLAKQAALGLFGQVDDDSQWWRLIDRHDLTSDLEDPERAPLGLTLARRALRLSDQIAHEVIDFDDMIFLPVVRNMRVWTNDWVLVDEAQDTNPARRALARKMLHRGGRAIFVGDDRQAIYGFTGADADAIDRIMGEFNCAELPLTVTYRCPKAVVREAQVMVPDIVAHESAPDGEVRSIPETQLLQEGLQATDAILCRKTAPLVRWAFRLIRAGVACHVEGRDIGLGLLALTKRWRVKTVSALRDRLEAHREREVEKLNAAGKEAQAEAVADRVETLLVLMEDCPDVDCVRRKVERLFADDAPTLTLATVHRSKGREWERVYVLGRHQYMPSPYARQDWQVEQEINLIYVAVTRSKDQLTYVEVAP